EAKMRRWKLILSEATKQARAFSIPELFPVIKVKDIDALSLPAFKYGAFLGRGNIDLLDCAPKDKAAIAIGPEGDWSKAEMQMLENFGFKPVRLGARIMRSPTAAAVGTAILSMLLEKE
ncbi:MAG: RNA methyltransferase, partial [Thermovirga sp.]|nr:RNA methyltransferase [Thermovirga sp.]